VQFPDACSAALSGRRLAALKAPRYINIENAPGGEPKGIDSAGL
jgi:hypothetical protein